MDVLIMGNGIAGKEVAFNLKCNLGEKGKATSVTLLSREKCRGYDPSTLPYLISGTLRDDAVFMKKPESYRKNGIEVILDAEVVSINPNEHSVSTKKGKNFSYDKLVLAYGADTFVPPIKGINKTGVFAVKTLREAERLSQHNGSSVVIIGSGPIGIEIAEALKTKGYSKVTIIELLDWILPALFCESTSRKLESELRKNNIEIYTGEKVLSIEGKNKVEGVVTNKREIACDTVINTAGVFVDKTFLPREMNTNRGIKVDKTMKTNIEGIYACGDCAETYNAITGENCLIQLKHNAAEQAKIVAENILSEKESYYRGSYAFARINFFSMHAVTFGHTFASATKIFNNKDSIEVLERDFGNNYLRLILRKGEIIGGQAIGDIANYMGFLIGAMWRKDNINDLKREWKNIVDINSRYPWIYRKIGQIIGLNFVDTFKVMF